jgi:hypothetical protein
MHEGTTDAARPLWAEYVTGTYFSTLGVGAFSGRVFAADDDRPSAPPVAVLSHYAWQGSTGPTHRSSARRSLWKVASVNGQNDSALTTSKVQVV